MRRNRASAVVAVVAAMATLGAVLHVLDHPNDDALDVRVRPASTAVSHSAPSDEPSAATSSDMNSDWFKTDPAYADLKRSIDQLNEVVKSLQVVRRSEPTRDDPIALLLRIDNPVVHYAGMTGTACVPYLVADHNAFYCSLDDTIYMSSWADGLPYGIRVFIMAHEDGHSEDPGFQPDTPTSELFADRYGGAKIGQLYRDGRLSMQSVREIRDFLSTIGSPTHGNGARRVAAFDQGFNS